MWVPSESPLSKWLTVPRLLRTTRRLLIDGRLFLGTSTSLPRQVRLSVVWWKQLNSRFPVTVIRNV